MTATLEQLAPRAGVTAAAVRAAAERGRKAGSYAGFGEQVLHKSFYPKQREALDALNEAGSLVTFASCNGGGKTQEVIATAILAHLVLYRGKVVVTSGSWAQITSQLMPALEANEHKVRGIRVLEKRVETDTPASFMQALSTSEAGRFEGHHGSREVPLLIVIDEAKTVKDPIFQAVDRCRIPREHCRILFASSPGYAQGTFFQSHTDRNFGLTHPPIKQTAADCPHISQAEIAAARLKWGAEHPLVRSMVDCEFMPFVQGAIVQLNELDALLADPPPFVDGECKWFFDSAWSESASGDETVLAERRGNRLRLVACFRERGLHATSGRLVGEFVRLGLSPADADQIEGDNGGEGSLLIDQLHKMNWQVGRANNGDPPRWNDRYANLAAEFWVDGAMGITQRQWILPRDTDLYGQMLNRRLVPNNKGLLAIESKQAMKDPNREGGAVKCSPDRADAVFGAMARHNRMRPQNLIQQAPAMRAQTDWSGEASDESSGERRFFN